VSCDGEWIDGGKFPPLLGLFATILKAKRSAPLNKTKYFNLDVVHMDVWRSPLCRRFQIHPYSCGPFYPIQLDVWPEIAQFHLHSLGVTSLLGFFWRSVPLFLL
jgi:hypothetical protein